MDATMWTILLIFSAVGVTMGHRHPPGHQWQNDHPDSPTLEDQCTKRHHGCTVRENRCHCYTVTGCTNPWPYKNIDECHDDQKGSLDVCKHHPSCGQGFCVQTKHNEERRAKCECAGSGYYGQHCQKKCPDVLGRLEANYPEACLLS